MIWQGRVKRRFEFGAFRYVDASSSAAEVSRGFRSTLSVRIRADLSLAVVAILWGSAFAAQRIAGSLGSVHFFNGARFLLAALIILPFAVRRGFVPGQFAWMGAAGVILFVSSAAQQAGLRTTTAGNAGFLTSLYVIIVPIVLLIGWRERPSRAALAAIFLAAAGAYLLSTGGSYRARAGDVLEVVGAAMWSVHVVLLGKVASRYDSLSFSFGQIAVCGLLSLSAGAILEPLPWPPPAPLFISIAYTAIFSLSLGYTLQVWGQRHTPPTDAAVILSAESVFAAMSGYLVLGERLAWVQIVGCAFILGAVLFSQFGARSRIMHPGADADQGPSRSRRQDSKRTSSDPP
jgi:drug/metabolite transporter (DMT)-like permease